MDESDQQAEHSDQRLLKRTKFWFAFYIFLFLVFWFVTWPLHYVAMVCWVYGSHAYFHDGIRVLTEHKRQAFSDGTEIPVIVDMVTQFGVVMVTFIIPILLLRYALRFYERHFGQKGKTR